MDSPSSIREFKVIIVGDFAVGKTSLLNAFMGIHDPNPASTITPGSTKKTVETNLGEQICCQFWDTAGDERYQQLTPNFTRNAQLVIVCFLRKESKSASKWIENVAEYNPDASFVGAMTKVDEFENDSEAIREADTEAGELQNKHGLIAVHLTSSREESKYYKEFARLLGAGFDRLATKPVEILPLMPLPLPPQQARPCC
jgi:small GTP-binding protein